MKHNEYKRHRANIYENEDAADLIVCGMALEIRKLKTQAVIDKERIKAGDELAGKLREILNSNKTETGRAWDLIVFLRKKFKLRERI